MHRASQKAACMREFEHGYAWPLAGWSGLQNPTNAHGLPRARALRRLCHAGGAHAGAHAGRTCARRAQRIARARCLPACQLKRVAARLQCSPPRACASALATSPNTRSRAQLQCDVHVPALTMTRPHLPGRRAHPAGQQPDAPASEPGALYMELVNTQPYKQCTPHRPPNATLRTGGRPEA